MHILLIEDEEKLAQIIVRGLKNEGYTVDVANNGIEGLKMATNFVYDLLLIDVMLPGILGTQVLRSIRENNPSVRIIMLTALDAINDKVTHFELGADDYLTKPFAFSELVVRIKSLLRRSGQPIDDVIRISDFTLNRYTRKVERAGKAIQLSAKEFSLLEYLASNAGRVLSRAMIIDQVWDQSFDNLANIVDVYVRQLRIKIDENHDLKLIQTVRGIGYRFTGNE